MQKYKVALKAILKIYCIFLIALFLLQRLFIYHPETAHIQDNYGLTYSQDQLQTLNAEVISDNNEAFYKAIQWIFLPSEHYKNKVLIYFHGNAGMAIDRAWKAEYWRKAGYHVVLAEYPGYGTNSGQPNEDNLYESGRIIIDHTLTRFPDADMYVYGESLGSGVAVQMATEYDEKGLIIESGFSSLVDVVYYKMPFVPVFILLKDQFLNDEKIHEIGSYLTVIHGRQDKLVPLRFGQRLFDSYQGDGNMIIIEDAAHNDIYLKTDMNKIIEAIK